MWLKLEIQSASSKSKRLQWVSAYRTSTLGPDHSMSALGQSRHRTTRSRCPLSARSDNSLMWLVRAELLRETSNMTAVDHPNMSRFRESEAVLVSFQLIAVVRHAQQAIPKI